MKICKLNTGFCFLLVIALLIIQLLMLTGCGRPQGRIFAPLDQPLVWPEPPDIPRIRYVGQISTEDDLKKEITFGQGLKNLIFGREDIGVLVGPYSVIRDADDKLYIADSGSGVIQVFDLTNRQHSFFTDIGNEQTLNTPVALTFVEDRVYVVDSVLKKVCIFTKDGDFKFSFGDDKLKRPTGIAYCSKLQRLYVSDTGSHVIMVYDKKGESLQTIGKRGSAPGSFNFPTHLWVDKFDRLLISDTLNYRVQIFSTEGEFIKTFGTHGDRPGAFAHPCGIASDSDGNIYVTDRQFENVQIFNKDGAILMAIGQEGSGPGEFWLPGGVFVDDNDRIYMADSFNGRVQVFELLKDVVK
jgi:DNA-binding beta-propeller fold protein YncE